MSEQGEVDISGLDKAELLAALYNGSHQQGMGFLHARGSTGMTVEQAQAEIDERNALGPGRLYFDYLHGRVLKVDLCGSALRTRLYNRDVGDGAAENIVAALRTAQKAAQP